MTAQRARHRPSPIVAAGAISLAFAFLLLVFAWPAARLEPRELPLGIVGPPSATRQIEQQLLAGDRFAPRLYADEPSARRALEDREIYGALVVSESGRFVLTASAASPLVARMLAQTLAPPGTAGTQVADVVPTAEEDPLGSVFGSLLLPLGVCGLLIAVAAVRTQQSTSRQLGLLIAASAGAALAGVALIQGWLGALDGPWVVNGGVLLLTLLAISTVLVGLARSFGTAGLGLGAITFVLVGNAWSAVASAPELLPEPASAIGQLLPPGAGADLLRSTAFFDGAGWKTPAAVLAAWVAVGLAAMYAGGSLRARIAGRRRAATSIPLAIEGVTRVQS